MPVSQDVKPGLADDLRQAWPHPDGGPATTTELVELARKLVATVSGGKPAQRLDERLVGASLHRRSDLFAMDELGRWIVVDPVLEKERLYRRHKIDPPRDPAAHVPPRRSGTPPDPGDYRSAPSWPPSAPREAG